MHAMALRLAEANPDSNAGYDIELVPLTEQMIGDVRPTLWTLMGAVTLILLIACANVANLLLARAGDREKEMAMRAALGAKPARIVRQLLTESVVLASISGVLGLALAYTATPILVRLASASVLRAREISSGLAGSSIHSVRLHSDGSGVWARSGGIGSEGGFELDLKVQRTQQQRTSRPQQPERCAGDLGDFILRGAADSRRAADS